MYFIEVVNELSDSTLLFILGISLAIACYVVYSSKSIVKKLSHLSKTFLVFLSTVLYVVIILLVITAYKFFTQL